MELLGIAANTVARESAVINEDPVILGTIWPYGKSDLYPREIMKIEKGKFGNS